MWLDPRAKSVVRWNASAEELSGLLIPSDTLNVIDVWHVDEYSRIHPQTNLAEIEDGSLTEGVYRRWLDQAPGIRYQPNETVRVRFPRMEGETIVFREEDIPIKPGPLTPFVEPLDSSSHQVTWDTGRSQSVVDLQLELEQATGATYFTKDDDGYLMAGSERLPGYPAASTDLCWQPPLDDLFPVGAGIDHLNHLAMMRDCVNNMGSGEEAEALKEAERWFSHFSGRITSFQYLASFNPMRAAMARHGENEILFAVDGKFGVTAKSLEELRQNPKFVAIMNSSVQVTWLDGWLGYMWWEIYQDILEGVRVRPCDHCGRVLRGANRKKRYCGPVENPECSRERSIIRKRQSRLVEAQKRKSGSDHAR